MSSEGLVSCDTFIVMRDSTVSGETIFGKNSDRPKGEIQEVVFIPSKKNESKTLKCTYIIVEQVPATYAVFLSKPEWMWGAEMGANEFGVVIGNEAVWNRLSESSHDLVPRLLGMDLLRLGLERSKTAREGLEVITGLLEKYGQGGQCSNIIHDFSYHNSFLIADFQEAWILETADKLWAAEHVETGYRNISNCMSITTKIDRCHPDLKSRAKSEGWWDGVSEFNWSDVIGNTSGDLENPGSRFSCGRELLKERCEGSKFNVKNMMEVLRDEASGINRPSGDFPTAGSQVSILAENSGIADIHWFTATLCPTR
ncbi:secernin-3 isoform X2 [Eurytemora carolleeae]|nr:secernin-3 isoform X2 [Eurytemora carolleeae]|eukprot:XP_023330377.1 secernin-3-like isoform X2 [Eurytemora affinis]